MKVIRGPAPVSVSEQVVVYLSLDEADRLRRFLQWTIDGIEAATPYSDLWELHRRMNEALENRYA